MRVDSRSRQIQLAYRDFPPWRLAASRDYDLLRSRAVRTIFRARELALGATPDDTIRPGGLLEQMQSLGWGVLAEVPDRQVVAGAVTKPWEANVIFRAIPPAEFAAFAEPGYVKIAWTLRAVPAGPSQSTFVTETRAVATDPVARARFRRYWAFASPGIITIRWLVLRPLRDEAERRARNNAVVTTPNDVTARHMNRRWPDAPAPPISSLVPPPTRLRERRRRPTTSGPSSG